MSVNSDPLESARASRVYRDPATVIEELALETGRAHRRRLLQLINERPAEEVIPLLAMELSECSDARRFERVANALAQVGGPEAADALARHARTQRRFPGLAIHALAKCADERVIPLLADLAEYGRHQQRVSSMRALARMKEVRSVETLCRIAKNRKDSLQMIAVAALRRKGGAQDIANRILLAPDLQATERVRSLLAMEGAPVHWRAFSAEKFLKRTLKNPKHPVRPEAERVLDLLRAQGTLLRAATGSDHTLLRAAKSAEAASSANLLRASDVRSVLPGSPSLFEWLRSFLMRILRR